VPRHEPCRLDKAQAAVRREKEKYASSAAEIETKIGALRRERDAPRSARDARRRKLEERCTRAEEAYRQALDEWRG
jgi:hypothetical protein